MSDRELLELAARAAGYTLGHGDIDGFPYFCLGGRVWNPLDIATGDALRLAVRLHIDIEIYNACVEAVWFDEALSETHAVVEYCDEKFQGVAAKEAATCRAIVRAAAEIARAAA